MHTLNFVIFNENFWDQGLIRTQNVIPLKKLCNKKGYKLKILSFTSVYSLFKNRRQIKQSIKELNEDNISISLFPVLFIPTRYMILKIWLVPFFFLNILPYLIYLNLTTNHKNDVFLCRSYPISLGFLTFYKNKKSLNFDPRTDWIEENINIGYFKKNSLSVRYWINREKAILKEFNKTYFISEHFKKTVLHRHNLSDDSNKYHIQYNVVEISYPIDHISNNSNFLYTGSLGHWNNIDMYLDFFLKVNTKYPNSNLIICTTTDYSKLQPSLSNPKYKKIINRVKIFYNLSRKELLKQYAQCKYGLQIMNKPDSRVGVKFIEYIAYGMVPIANENVLGAREIIDKYGIGAMIPSTTSDSKLTVLLEKANSFNQENPYHKALIKLIDSNNAYLSLIQDE